MGVHSRRPAHRRPVPVSRRDPGVVSTRPRHSKRGGPPQAGAAPVSRDSHTTLGCTQQTGDAPGELHLVALGHLGGDQRQGGVHHLRDGALGQRAGAGGCNATQQRESSELPAARPRPGLAGCEHAPIFCVMRSMRSLLDTTSALVLTAVLACLVVASGWRAASAWGVRVPRSAGSHTFAGRWSGRAGPPGRQPLGGRSWSACGVTRAAVLTSIESPAAGNEALRATGLSRVGGRVTTREARLGERRFLFVWRHVGIRIAGGWDCRSAGLGTTHGASVSSCVWQPADPDPLVTAARACEMWRTSWGCLGTARSHPPVSTRPTRG